MLTVGLNPSHREFPAHEPFRRFPGAEGVTGGAPDLYLDALSAYFRTNSLRDWFNSFEPLLNVTRVKLLRGRGLDGAAHRHLLPRRYRSDVDRPR